MINHDPVENSIPSARQIIPRRSHTKSRTGCQTCKIRRVRCDETWPVCQRCSGTGRCCNGPSAKTKGPNKKFDKVIFVPPLTLNAFQPPIISYESEQERHYLGLFCTRLVQGVSGYAPYPIWGPLLIQAIREERAVYQAAIAVSALVTSRASFQGTRSGNALAFQQYGKCLASLQTVAQKPDDRAVAVVLLCSLLCIYFEVLSEDHPNALAHLEHCLKILEAQDGRVDPDLASTYIRLDLQASSYLGMRPPALALRHQDREIPVQFKDIDEAEMCLQNVLNQHMRFQTSKADDYRYRIMGSVPLGLLSEAATLEHRLEQWHQSCSAFYSEPGYEDWHPARLALLQIKYYLAVIMMATCLYAEECIYDRFKEQFATIVSLAETLLETTDTFIPRHWDQATFSMEMGVIHPLYITACKCRDSRIRQHAIELLEVAPLTEGVWHGGVMAAIARRVRFHEEEGHCQIGSDIPEFRRVHSADLQINHRSRQTTVSFRRLPNGVDGEWDDLVEVIYW